MGWAGLGWAFLILAQPNPSRKIPAHADPYAVPSVRTRKRGGEGGEAIGVLFPPLRCTHIRSCHSSRMAEGGWKSTKISKLREVFLANMVIWQKSPLGERSGKYSAAAAGGAKKEQPLKVENGEGRG